MIRRTAFGLAIGVAVLAAAAAPAGAVDDDASCVGQFSAFFAHGGEDTHRSQIATGFAHDAAPAGRNVYSHVADVHGSLQACFEASGG